MTSLRNCPIYAQRHFGAPPNNMLQVVRTCRRVLLKSVNIPDDGPSILRIDSDPNHPSPMCLNVNLSDNSAIVLLKTEGEFWAQQAYQFGHELGHVLANSWKLGCQPLPPSQWVEEALVESFSLLGLYRLASEWSSSPNLNWQQYSKEFRNYADLRLKELKNHPDFKLFRESTVAWFKDRRTNLESLKHLGEEIHPFIPSVFKYFIKNEDAISDLAALNRWPERNQLKFGDYCDSWYAASKRIGSSGNFPIYIRKLLVTTPMTE